MSVEPIGTITMCFPHVDEETRSVLQSVMDEAENFGDFTEKLCDRVCAEASSPLLEYFALYFAWWLDWLTLVDRLVSAGKVSDLGSPILLLTRARKGEVVSWDDSKKSMKRALMAAPNDWLASHLYLTWRLLADSYYPESDIDIRPIDAITSSVETNKDLACFKTYLLYLKALEYDRETKRKEMIDQLRKALVVAREFDDEIIIVDIIIQMASRIKQTDVKQAIDLLISCRELAEKLGHKHSVGQVQLELGFIMQLKGELNAAIEYHMDYKKIRELLGLDTRYTSYLIACMYNQIGQGEEAFELAKIAVDFASSASTIRLLPRPHAELAWALINLGRYDEAGKELAIAYELATKSGHFGQMEWVQLVGGILDKAEGDFNGAIAVFEEVLENQKNDPVPVLQNICLINLTEIEIKILTNEALKKRSDLSGPWMAKLVEHAEKNDLPGIVARALLLKAELRRKQGRFDEMRNLLKQVQKTAKAPSMKYLNDLAISMFPDIIVD